MIVAIPIPVGIAVDQQIDGNSLQGRLVIGTAKPIAISKSVEANHDASN